MQVTFKLKCGNALTLFISKHAHIAVTQEMRRSDYTNKEGEYVFYENVVITDGLHNNGGWKIAEPYEQVIAKIAAALQAQS